MNKIGRLLVILVFTLFISGCGNTVKESTFECLDTSTGKFVGVVLTFKTEDGEKIFYDNDVRIGTRAEAIKFASEKTGFLCKAGTDRE